MSSLLLEMARQENMLYVRAYIHVSMYARKHVSTYTRGSQREDPSENSLASFFIV